MTNDQPKQAEAPQDGDPSAKASMSVSARYGEALLWAEEVLRDHRLHGGSFLQTPARFRSECWDRIGAMTIALPQPQLDAIAEACQQHQVQRMHLFGSALRDDFNPSRSDLDLLVEFQPIEPGALVQAYFGLEQQLSAITGKPVDLVMADAVRNPYVRREIEASKQLIYEA